MKKLTPQGDAGYFYVAFSVLPDKLKRYMKSKMDAINNHKDEVGQESTYSKKWNIDNILVIEDGAVKQSGDYSINFIGVFDLRKMNPVPIANKLNVQRHLYTMGLVRFWGLTDRWALKPQGDEMKLAAGHYSIDLGRHEVLIHFVHTYDGNRIYLGINRNSPLRIYYGYETFRNIKLREYIGLKLLKKSKYNRNPDWKLSNGWRYFFKEWSKNEKTVVGLINKGYLSFKKEGFPSITSKGEAHLENLMENGRLDDAEYNTVTESLRRDKIDFVFNLDKPMFEVLEESHGLE
tara:strand:+ start:854 stop:1726 length:873 start_codon:yes stop_codon:yes gene_type:complete